jgi:ABC-type sulfate/molybdate transport systems ATPase subunit
MLEVEINSFSYSDLSPSLDDKAVLKNIKFSLQPGQHLSVLGESGGGKSTLLHIIYGLLHLENGQIRWNNEQLLGPTKNLIPGEDFMKLVAQEYNVMPFTTVSENIASHLSRRNHMKDDFRVLELLALVELESEANTLVKNLSGGQKQRVALAKALANPPQLLLLDEPFSNIDTFRKNKLRRDLYTYLKQNNIGCITATHDSEEALGYFDQVLLLKGGTMEVMATPEDVFSQANTTYRAGFFGEVTRLPARLFSSEITSEEIILLPHQLGYTEVETQLKVSVKNSYFRGSHYLIQADWNGRDVFFEHSEKLTEKSVVNLSRK